MKELRGFVALCLRGAACVLLIAAGPAHAGDVLDLDADGIPDEFDNCLYVPNPSQEDRFSFDQPGPDGRGDACECGDVSDDGAITLLDVVLLRRDIVGLPPGLPAPHKCRVVPGGSCDGADVSGLRDALAAGNGAGLAQVCDAATLGQPGSLCFVDGGCAASLLCIDGTCCTSTCSGTCESCNLPGTRGICTAVPAGQDPASECGAIPCTDFSWGFSGRRCLQRADVSAAVNVCNGGGACLTAADLCPSQGPGPATLVCDAECQDPEPGTCVGTTPGACRNLDTGTVTCSTGICEATVPRCVNGDLNICTPGVGEPETCNLVDDDCDGSIDEDLPDDEFESNDSCATAWVLPTAGTSQQLSITTAATYPAADHDWYRISGLETGTGCACCDFFCTDEDFKLTATLTAPPGSIGLQLCTAAVCGDPLSCKFVSAGETVSNVATHDGSCNPTTSDTAFFFVRVRAQGSVSECLPYTLTYRYDEGCF